MKAALALVAVLALAGCASDGYYTSAYGGSGYYDRPYYDTFGSTYYSYGSPYYYSYPSVGGTVYYHDRDDRRWDGRHDDRWRERDRDARDWRERNVGQPEWRGPEWRGPERSRGAIGDADPAEGLPRYYDGQRRQLDNPLGRGAEGR